MANGPGIAQEKYRARWFAQDDAFDEQCRKRFAGQLEAVMAGTTVDWAENARNWLALIILCDQMPRNIYRASKTAFAWDSLALTTARQGIEQGIDRELCLDERYFAYMPFEHSEAILDQHTAVGLMTDTHDSAPKEYRNITGNLVRYAQKHRDIIVQFGRFPHRNAVLNRTNTEAESQFLRDHDGFGQN